MEEHNILLNAREIEEKYHIPYNTIMKAKREGAITGVKIGAKYLFDEERVIKPWLGLEISTDKVMELKLENQKLKNKVEMYKNQYKIIKQLLDTLNGACNVI
ncbi:hypothetical protein JW813_14140 [Clostridium botulinum]|uniref:hypothetical protein n=1 Tax=Clostridium botulinum TaxID=1491 RepID=UPI0013CD97A9|nr:hypothetical protein [Clostridium botulinum]NFN17316.1 hypothetical protein [Clostridium botulinum]NFN47916.1 hypothetical protein [Clostridium botulinum]NFN80399.1 hypothetical protein [Clostridium botulinum]UZP02838.1 hypothetical protein JW813_14140 [Clostridium botulinum]UZP06196.1 hypothetical protein JYA71_14410 [Clostridium botulinum]